jgi:hypothetical protein
MDELFGVSNISSRKRKQKTANDLHKPAKVKNWG